MARAKKRALVLGGGGVAGIAWETGVLLGLLEAGINALEADAIIGTSAGAAVGAQITSGVPLGELYDRHVFPTGESIEMPAEFDATKMATELSGAMASTPAGDELRAAIARYALAAPAVPERRRWEVIAARLPSHDWPEADLRIVAVDAGSGQERVFTRADGVGLVDAVAASCAVPGVWPPVTIGDRRYVDGGVRSTTNLDLAAGFDPVLVLAPSPELGLDPAIDKAAARLTKKANVVTIRPDEDSLEAIGINPLDPATAKPAAQAGRAQAAAIVDEVGAVWTGQ